MASICLGLNVLSYQMKINVRPTDTHVLVNQAKLFKIMACQQNIFRIGISFNET